LDALKGATVGKQLPNVERIQPYACKAFESIEAWVELGISKWRKGEVRCGTQYLRAPLWAAFPPGARQTRLGVQPRKSWSRLY
jgi:hypothetical protein